MALEPQLPRQESRQQGCPKGATQRTAGPERAGQRGERVSSVRTSGWPAAYGDTRPHLFPFSVAFPYSEPKAMETLRAQEKHRLPLNHLEEFEPGALPIIGVITRNNSIFCDLSPGPGELCVTEHLFLSSGKDLSPWQPQGTPAHS